MIAISYLFVISSFVSVIHEVQSAVEVKRCGQQPEPNDVVKAIRVSGCNVQRCKFEQGKNYTFEFDLIPTETTSKVDVEAKAYGTLKWPGFETDACKVKALQCPVQKNHLITYKNTVHVNPSYPKIPVAVDWIVKFNNVKAVCFRTDVEIIAPK